MEERFTAQELANRWGITRNWLYHLKARGEVPKFSRSGPTQKARIVFSVSDVVSFEKENNMSI